MWQYNYSDEHLCHWGIKGMKWGVRRYQNKDGSLTPAGKKRYPSESKSKKKKVSEMTDQELREIVTRMNLESNYKKLTASPSTFKKATTIVAGIATGMGAITSLYNQSRNIMKIGKEVTDALSTIPMSAWDERWLY